jgi:DNA (cytosine-5)-methyltransferase 1
MKHISFFSGIGGFDLASEWMGWENVAHCEINEFCLKILNYYWPNAKTHRDIKSTDFSIYRGLIDIVTGGFPCQPFSVTGQRKGNKDDRHLWPEMFRAVCEIQPTWVVGENVPGLVNWSKGLVFEQVQADLEASGYEVQSFILPACGINAPHRRERIWFVAYRNGSATQSSRTNREAKGNRSENNDEQEGGRVEGKQHNGCSNVLQSFTNSDDLFRGSEPQFGCGNKTGSRSKFEGSNRTEDQSEWRNLSYLFASPGEDATNATGIEDNRNGQGGFQSKFAGIISDFRDFPTQSPICTGNDGISAGLDGITFPKWRNESIKGAGNAIVPQIAHMIFKAIEQYKTLL